jgi:hypothetical protein
MPDSETIESIYPSGGTVGIPLGKHAREIVTHAREVAEQTSGFIRLAVGLSLLALGLAAAALYRGSRAAA